LWYFLHSSLITLSQKIFNLSDDWFSNLIRLNNFAFSIISLIIVNLLLFIKSKNKSINFGFSFLLLFGPLTGFWNISAKPDFGYLIFEVLAIYLFLVNIEKLNIKKILIITFFLYLSWSVKQTSIISSIAIFIYLALKKDKLIFYYCVFFLFLIILTFIIGGENYIKNMLWLNAETKFSLNHFIKLLLSSVAKIFPIFSLGFLFFLNNLKGNFFEIKNSNFNLFCLIGLICSLINIVLSLHVGSAPNYYFVTSIYLLLISSNYLEKFTKNYQIKFYEKLILNSSLVIQSILVSLVLFGYLGTVKPIYYSDVKILRSCTKNLLHPIFFGSADYYRLPWIAGQYEKNPIIQNWFYSRKYNNVDLPETPLYKIIKKGKFNSLVLSDYEKNSYSLDKYKLKIVCSGKKDYFVFQKN